MNNLKIRQLKFNDVYEAAKILKNIDIDVDQKIFNGDSNIEGLKIILNIISNSEKCKVEINNFLGGLFGISGEEFGNLDFEDSIDCMEQFQNLKGIKRFFNTVKRLMK